MKLGMRVGLGPGHIVLEGDPAPLPQKGHTPQFSAHICHPKMAGWIKMPLRREVGLSPSDIVLDGDTAPLPKKGGRAPQFSAYIYCGKTARWIKMPLGMEVSLGIGHIVLDRDPALHPPKKGAQHLRMSHCHYVTVIRSHDQKDAINNYFHFAQRGTAPQFSADVYCGQTVTHLSCC